ncbi:MAG: amidohydrolase family protein [Candidatus Baltobacteraceae bacterium]
MAAVDRLVRAKTIVTCTTDAPQNGISFERLGQIDDAAMLLQGDRVAAIGPRLEVERELHSGTAASSAAKEIYIWDFPDHVLVPGFVDAHSHPLYAGDREPDFAARLRGEKPPLGMLHTVEQTRNALVEHPDRFWHDIRERLALMLAHGTTTLETKTGYALHKPGEVALLDLIDLHKNDPDIPRLIATFLGAHALPPEFSKEAAYIDYLIAHIIPVAKAHGAVYADAFCEPGFFSPEQTRRYLQACRDHGLRLRVHCDEMAFGAAAEMAVELDVDAVDHCNCIHESDVAAIVDRNIVTVACPTTIGYLDLPNKAPVRELLERGGRVALASDYNPGTSPCFNLQTVAYFGRKLFGLSAAEALYSVTRAAAQSLRADAGVLQAGALADFVALQLGSPAEFGWQFGGNLATCVVRGGVKAA